MNTLIVGATGYIGSAVADALGRAGHAAFGLARSDEARRRLAGRGLKAVAGDIHDAQRLAQVAGEFDAVIWAASSDAGGAAEARALEACVDRLSGTGRTLLYTSGAWVHGDTAGEVADEESPLRPPALVSFRVGLERSVLSARSMRGVVLRPGIVYGRGAGIPAMLVASARAGGAARFVGSGLNRWPLVFIDDLAELYVRAMSYAPVGTVLLAVQGPHFRVEQLARAASEGAGARGRTRAWPLDEARAELGAFADALVLDQTFSALRARTLLGWSPRGPSLLDELTTGSYVRS